MHNNDPINVKRTVMKDRYTVLEAGVLWARAEGAKNASDPRINSYAQLILDAIKSGDFGEHPNEISSVDAKALPTLSSTVVSTDLKHWIMKRFPRSRPAFLFSGNS